MWLCLRMAHAQADGLVPERREPAGLLDSEITTADVVSAAKPLPPYDPYWREKIKRAKREWEEGRKEREGKPIVFSDRRSSASDLSTDQSLVSDSDRSPLLGADQLRRSSRRLRRRSLGGGRTTLGWNRD